MPNPHTAEGKGILLSLKSLVFIQVNHVEQLGSKKIEVSYDRPIIFMSNFKSSSNDKAPKNGQRQATQDPTSSTTSTTMSKDGKYYFKRARTSQVLLQMSAKPSRSPPTNRLSGLLRDYGEV